MEELTGDLVLVNPKLVDDPAHKRGEIGIITYADLKEDVVLVTFGEKSLGAYSTNALLTLKPKNELHKDLLNNGKELGKEDLKVAWRAHLLQELGKPTHFMQAYELLASNPNALEFSTIRLNTKIEMAVKMEQNTASDHQIGR